MKKREACRGHIGEVLTDRSALERLLLRESGLPGRRANLELAAAFADVIEERGDGDGRAAWLHDWAALSAEEAPTNDPHEFLPFVAVQALGASYAGAAAADRQAVEQHIREAATDPRWRLHEAAAFALQRIGDHDWTLLEPVLTRFGEAESMLVARAALVAVAHPPLLHGPDVATFGLELADQLMDRFVELTPDARKTPAALVLQKALQFAPSVVVAAAPGEGFSMLSRWAGREQIDIKKIVAANLRKARLARHFPDEVEDVGATLSESWD